MHGWFRIETDDEHCLVCLTMGGFFDRDTIVRMRNELATVIGSLPCRPNDHVTLCDIREMSIQSQERVDDFTHLVGQNEIRSRRLAFVTAASLARLQARRLTTRACVGYFSDAQAALQWLFEPKGVE